MSHLNPSHLIKQLRSALEADPDSKSTAALLYSVDKFVKDGLASEAESMMRELEELHILHQKTVDYSRVYQTELFLAVLSRLSPILPSTSVISWFELLLRPALREPKLATHAVNYAKDIIVNALQKTQDVFTRKIDDFRRRLIELYLLDVYNEASSDDVIEWTELDEDQRRRRKIWKINLEDILVKYGFKQPYALLSEMHTHFNTPSLRLQLMGLLHSFSSSQAFPSAALVLARHPLMESLLLSMMFDNSSVVCTSEITLMVKLLPYFAVHARDDLRKMLPLLLAILARVMCWSSRSTVNSRGEESDDEFENGIETATIELLNPLPELKWQRLETVFRGIDREPPSCSLYFTSLYYLYPSNVLKFLRSPVQYMASCSQSSPCTDDWSDVFNEDMIRRLGQKLLREHACHPYLLWYDNDEEPAPPEFWARYDLSRIVSEVVMLDVKNLAISLRQRFSADASRNLYHGKEAPTGANDDISSYIRYVPSTDAEAKKIVISLQDMISTSVALKSNVVVEIVPPSAQGSLVSTSFVSSPYNRATPRSRCLDETGRYDVSSAAQALTTLQREIVLLRNELNIEVWLSRENVKHIGNLYRDQVLTKTADVERQGLYNKMRKYRQQIASLEKDLRERKVQASSAKSKYVDWNAELQRKLKSYRSEKRDLMLETASLRGNKIQTYSVVSSQGKRLQDMAKEIGKLRTERKEKQHKIDRLRDYERALEQQINIERLWEKDFAKFKDCEDQVKEMECELKRMHLLLESLRKTNQKMEEAARDYRRTIQTWEIKFAQTTLTENRRRTPVQDIVEFAAKKDAFKKANKRLMDENAALKDEVGELKAMIEVLKAQQSRSTCNQEEL